MAQNHHIPVLGICRGMQMIGTFLGSELKRVDGHVNTQHQLTGVIERTVNSFHNFALTECPVNCQILARSEDQNIEAIKHDNLPFEGWMWHPEREKNICLQDVARIHALFAPF